MAIDFNYQEALSQALSPLKTLGEGQLSIAMLNRARGEKLADAQSEREHQIAMRKAEIASYAEKDLDMMLLKRGLSTSGSKEQKEERLFKGMESTAVNTYKYLKAQKGDKESELERSYEEYKNSATVTADPVQKVEALKMALRDPALDSLPKAQRAKLQAAAEGKTDPDEAVKAVSEYMTKTGWFSDHPERGRVVLDAYYTPLVKSLDEKKAISVMALKSKFDYVANELKGVESSISKHIIENGASLPQSVHDAESWRVRDQGPPISGAGSPPPVNPNDALKDKVPAAQPRSIPEEGPSPISQALEDEGIVGGFKSGTQRIADSAIETLQDPSRLAALRDNIGARAATAMVSPLSAVLPNGDQMPGVFRDALFGRSVPSIPPPHSGDMLQAIGEGRFNPDKHPGGVEGAKADLLERIAQKKNPARNLGPVPIAPPSTDLKTELKERVMSALQRNPQPVIFKVDPPMIDKIRSLMETEGGADDSAWNDFVTGVTDQSPAHIAYFNEMVKEIVLRQNSQAPPQ